MKKNTKFLILLPLLFSIGACSESEDGEDDGDGDSNNNNVSGIVVATASGDVASLTGRWETTCYSPGGGADVKEVLVFGISSATYTQYQYTTIDASCGGIESTDMSYSADVTTAATGSTITGWADGQGTAISAPTAADNSGALSDTEAFTNLTYTFTAIDMGGNGPSVGDTMNFVYIVDDTGTGSILYRGDYEDNSTMSGASAGIADPFILQ